MSAKDHQDQQHPQEGRDVEVINRLLREEPTNYNLGELARLRIRYLGFPGARIIQQNLDTILQRWQLTEDQLFEQTRQLHSEGLVYRRSESQGQEDWS
ncbi:MAG: DUF3288 family protein [Coleofasciculaceae cyanobacterium]